MLTQLLDVFSFLSVLLRGGVLAFQSLVLGGAVFAFCVLGGLPAGKTAQALRESWRRLICCAAVLLVVVQLCYLAADSAILAGTAGLRVSEVAGANFFVAGFAGAGAAMGIVALTMRAGAKPGIGLLALAAVTSGSLVMTSHAAGRLEHRLTLSILTALHQSAAAVWIGGMPYLVLALARCSGILTAQFVCRSFSRMAWIGVIALASSGAAMSLAYIGSAQAIYGTAYGAMVVSKVGMFGILLLLGAFNFFVTRRPMAAESWLLPRLRRFSEAEVGIGFTVILAAASLTSQPPAVDLLAGRVSAAEIAERMRPRWPSLSTPELGALSPATPLGFDAAETQPAGLQSFVPGASYKPNGPGDIAWSEYNHHWAGLIVLSVGLLALLARSGLVGYARHWPLAFLGLAIFLFLRADPENWPLGPRSFWQSFAVAEVLEHRAFVVLIVAFAVFEWRVQTGRVALSRARLVFPLVCASGGALLLTHTHPLGNIKEELLAELSHIPLAIFAVAAGWSRWLELRLAANQQRIPSWLWPVCFVLIGAVLLNYRES